MSLALKLLYFAHSFRYFQVPGIIKIEWQICGFSICLHKFDFIIFRVIPRVAVQTFFRLANSFDDIKTGHLEAKKRYKARRQDIQGNCQSELRFPDSRVAANCVEILWLQSHNGPIQVSKPRADTRFPIKPVSDCSY